MRAGEPANTCTFLSGWCWWDLPRLASSLCRRKQRRLKCLHSIKPKCAYRFGLQEMWHPEGSLSGNAVNSFRRMNGVSPQPDICLSTPQTAV